VVQFTAGTDIFPSYKAFRLALGHTQPPIVWVPGLRMCGSIPTLLHAFIHSSRSGGRDISGSTWQ